jgi:hypothetical protein
VSFAKTLSEGNEGSLIDGYWENMVCSRRPLQQQKQAAESQSGAVEAGTFRRKRQHKIHWGIDGHAARVYR